MYGNGAQIGMATTAAVRRPILRVLTVVLTERLVAVAGTTMRGSVARRIAAPARPTSAASTLASAWFLFPKINRNFIRNEPIYCRYFGHRSPAAVVALTPRPFIHKGVSVATGNKQHPVMWGRFNNSMAVLNWNVK